MSEWKEIFQFSRAETFALAILLLMVLIGGGILLYENSTETLPPELFFQSAGAATKQPHVNAPPVSQINPKPAPAPPQETSLTSTRKPAKPTSLLLNINTAPAESLMMLPRVGEVISQRIIELRERLGQFDSVEQLVQVRGIGKKTLELLRPNVTVGDTPSNTAKPDTAATQK
jgi:competence ComEA-like helix-hairpin-helix protein